jgi:hypothetical protein
MHAVLRACALSAVAGGLLRIVDSFTGAVLPAQTLAVLYFVTDVFLLAGIAGVWWRRRPALGWAAMAGLTVFVFGILAIRVSVFGALGANGYQLGATLALLGLAAYAIETLLRRNAAPWAPTLWLISLAFGIAGATGLAAEAMTVAAGVAFGAGFVAAGVETFTG